MLAVHVLYENIALEDRPEPARIIATNIFTREEAGWKMILHHASPAPRTDRPAEAPTRQVH